MKTLLTASVISLMFIASKGVSEEEESFLNVQELLRHCKPLISYSETERQPKSGIPFYRAGAIYGTAHVMSLNCLARIKGRDIPPNLTMGELPTFIAGAHAFIKWAEANPEFWGAEGAIGMAVALTETFPCKS